MKPQGIISVSVSKLNIITNILNDICIKFNLNNRFEMAFGEVVEGKNRIHALGIYFDDVHIRSIKLDDIYKFKDEWYSIILGSLSDQNIITPKIELVKKDD